MDIAPSYPCGQLELISPSDNAWRSKNYNMLIKEQRVLSEMMSLVSEGLAEGAELDTSRILSPSTLRIATTAGLLDRSTLEKLGLGHLIESTSSIESVHSPYSSTLLLDTKKIPSKQESITSYSQDSSLFSFGSGIEYGGFAIHPASLAKALRLLYVPQFSTTFKSEEEMIQVYQLIYDTLRYRVVFDQALKALSFFIQHPKLQVQQRIVHILFFDLHQRHFLSRDNFSSTKNKLIKDVSTILFEPEEEECPDFKEIVKEAESILWSLRIHLAASVARLRIRRHAFCLLSMLPKQLRNPSHLDGSAKRPLSFWINSFLIRKDTITCIFKDSGLKMLDKHFNHPRSSSILELQNKFYFYDSVCTNLLYCNPCLRSIISHSQLVKLNYLVIQDRSFCLGPSILCKKLSKMDINGAIVQTHISSVRVTAYLASLLNENKPSLAIKPDVVLAFGAGNRKTEYEASLKAMGVTNVIVYSEAWVQVASTLVQALVNASITYAETYPNIAISPEFTNSCIPIPIDMEDIFRQLDNVVAVYATPPNSYTAVPDPVELAVSRGGDIILLEDITRNMSITYEIAHEDLLNSNEPNEEEKYIIKLAAEEREKEEQEEMDKMNKLVKEQWEVLCICLSLPQIQMVLYESHSTKCSENTVVVENAVKAANDAARANFKRYQESQTAACKVVEEDGEQVKTAKDNVNENLPADGLEGEAKTIFNFENEIPLTDLFEVEELPYMKVAEMEDGCFISLIKRKELILMNNRYLIQMAEARGLFEKKVDGKVSSPSESAKGGKGKRKGRLSSIDSDYSDEYSSRPHTKKLEIERISAPTIASLRRSCRWSSWQQCKYSKREGEYDTNAEEKTYQYPCSRCASHGEEESLDSLKIEEHAVNKRIIIPYDNLNDGGNIKKRKSSINNELQGKPLKRFMAPTEVSLLRRNICWKQHKQKFEHKRQPIELEQSCFTLQHCINGLPLITPDILKKDAEVLLCMEERSKPIIDERKGKILEDDSLNHDCENDINLIPSFIRQPNKPTNEDFYRSCCGRGTKYRKRKYPCLYIESCNKPIDTIAVEYRYNEDKGNRPTYCMQDLTVDKNKALANNNNEQDNEAISQTDNFSPNIKRRKINFYKPGPMTENVIEKEKVVLSHSECLEDSFSKNTELGLNTDKKEGHSLTTTSVSTVRGKHSYKNESLAHNNDEKVSEAEELFDELFRITEIGVKLKKYSRQGRQESIYASLESSRIFNGANTLNVIFGYKYNNEKTKEAFYKKYDLQNKQKVDEKGARRIPYPLKKIIIKFRYPDYLKD